MHLCCFVRRLEKCYYHGRHYLDSVPGLTELLPMLPLALPPVSVLSEGGSASSVSMATGWSPGGPLRRRATPS